MDTTAFPEGVRLIQVHYSSTERSNEGNDISVNSNKSYESLNAVGDENVAEMDVVVVSEMAGADAVNRGRPLIEVIDEGEGADLSSDGIESFEDFLSSSSLTTLFSEDASEPLVTDPPVDFSDATDESDVPS